MAYLTMRGLGKDPELTSYHLLFGKDQGNRRLQSICPTNLPESFAPEFILAERCVPPEKTREPDFGSRKVTGPRQPGN